MSLRRGNRQQWAASKKRHYWRNREMVLAQKQAHRLAIKLQLLRLLGGSCIDCGYAGHPAALDFDHIDRSKKLKTVSSLLSGTLATALKEAENCVIRCANCHRIKTAINHESGVPRG